MKLVFEINIAKSKVMNFVTDSNERCFPELEKNLKFDSMSSVLVEKLSGMMQDNTAL